MEGITDAKDILKAHMETVLLKIAHIGVIRHGKIQLVLLQTKLHPYWLAFIVLEEGSMHTTVEESNQWSYPAGNPDSHNHNWPIGAVVGWMLWK